MQQVILNSGGMDSFLLSQLPDWEGARQVFVNVGQKYVAKELQAAKHIAAWSNVRLETMLGAQLGGFEHPSGIIPFRNAELILCAAQHGEDIGLGVIADEVNSDKSPAFLRAMTEVLDISYQRQYWTAGKTFVISTPLAGRTKAQHIRDFIDRGGDFDALLQTVSCYDAGDAHCGQCASCFKRWVALTVATGNPTIQYFVHDPWQSYDSEYLRSRMPTYSAQRVEETTRAFAAVGIAP